MVADGLGRYFDLDLSVRYVIGYSDINILEYVEVCNRFASIMAVIASPRKKRACCQTSVSVALHQNRAKFLALELRLHYNFTKKKLKRNCPLNKIVVLLTTALIFGIGCQMKNAPSVMDEKFAPKAEYIFLGEEPYIKNVRMLTHGGENAEAYFDYETKNISWQGQWGGNVAADQIWTMPLNGGEPKMISTGYGKTTCSFFIKGTNRIVYSSTHAHSKEPPPPVDMRKGYVWSLDEYDIYTVNLDGTDLVQLTNEPGYDAETAVSPDGKSIVFTSMRNGDLDIYTMNIDGSNVKQLTKTLGYDGGPFFTPDGEWIIFRSHLPVTEAEIQRYAQLLDERKVAPLKFELQIMRTDGSDRRQITELNSASFAPYVHPDGKRVIFCSNYGSDPASRMPTFNLFMINLDGTNLKQITHNASFDGFPMFSFDGKKLIWCSNRFGPEPRSTNIFVADWLD